MERLAKAQTRGDGSRDGNEGVVYGHFPHGIATEQLVVECESDGRDGDEKQQAKDAEHVYLRQRTAKCQS